MPAINVGHIRLVGGGEVHRRPWHQAQNPNPTKINPYPTITKRGAIKATVNVIQRQIRFWCWVISVFNSGGVLGIMHKNYSWTERTCPLTKDEGRALLLCCGLEPTGRRITAFSRPREHMWLVQHMDWVTTVFPVRAADMTMRSSWNRSDWTRLNWLDAFALSLPQHLLRFSWEEKKK